jgi:hypothetical protein
MDDGVNSYPANSADEDKEVDSEEDESIVLSTTTPSPHPQEESRRRSVLKRQIFESAPGSTRLKKAIKMERTRPSAQVTRSFATASTASLLAASRVTKGKNKNSEDMPRTRKFDHQSFKVDELLSLSHRDRQLAYDDAVQHAVEGFRSIIKTISRTERELGRTEGKEQHPLKDRRDIEVIEISDEGK